MGYDYLVVGAGLAGCVLAERLANGLQKRVLLVERRNHIGGNAYDFHDDRGLLVQRYGPHIFHTSNKAVRDYLSQFTTWNRYVHRVLANLGSRQVYLPINLDTMERLCDRTFTPEQLQEYFEQRRVRLAKIENARDVVVSQVGTELYELLFRNYTKKQWGLYPEQLDPQVTGRLPVRFDRDTRYFTDPWQGLPAEGYTRMFERMLDSPNIEVRLETDYRDIARRLCRRLGDVPGGSGKRQLADGYSEAQRHRQAPLLSACRCHPVPDYFHRDIAGSVDFRGLIFTGAIDEFFDCRYGRLPYRSLSFRFETLPVERFQNAGVVNYPNHQEYTRITEFKQLYLQEHPETTICYEYGSEEGPACYPVPTPANHALYARYKAEADGLDDTHFVGRLAQYQYLNMDQVVERALSLFREIQDRA